MNDREFIELLNLYVDREINPDESLRLEAEVEAHPERRRVYDQYCRMQRACSMLSAELAESAPAGPEGLVVEFPAPRAWRMAPVLAGLAAAAGIIAVVGLRDRGTATIRVSPVVAVEPGGSLLAPGTAEVPSAPDPMKPVFNARPLEEPEVRSAARPVFAMDEGSPQIAQLNWIEDIHMAPVFSAASPGLLLNPKPVLKAPVSNGAASNRDSQQPGEMTAFRFQR